MNLEMRRAVRSTARFFKSLIDNRESQDGIQKGLRECEIVGLLHGFDLFEVEKKEKEVLLQFCWKFRNSLEEFSTSVDRSLRYLDKIILPIVMASKEDKSYNPFAEIIEKYAMHILINKLEKDGYRLLPLGYSADLTLEYEDHILSIDIKTANLENPSDFDNTINVGINQLTHVARLRLGNRRKTLPDPFFVYPTLPPYFKFPDGRVKLVLTYGLMFVYPSYRDLIMSVRDEYNKLLSFFKDKVRKVLVEIMKKYSYERKEDIEKLLSRKPESSRYSYEDLIADSVIRGIFLHEQARGELLKALGIGSQELDIIDKFSSKLSELADNLRKKDVKPVAIIAIAIPNGLLKEKYIKYFVSGKNYAKSARYHYGKGIFEVIKERTNEEFPRVLFLDVNLKYLNDLKKYFDDIVVLDYTLKRL